VAGETLTGGLIGKIEKKKNLGKQGGREGFGACWRPIESHFFKEESHRTSGE